MLSPGGSKGLIFSTAVSKDQGRGIPPSGRPHPPHGRALGSGGFYLGLRRYWFLAPDRWSLAVRGFFNLWFVLPFTPVYPFTACKVPAELNRFIPEIALKGWKPTGRESIRLPQAPLRCWPQGTTGIRCPHSKPSVYGPPTVCQPQLGALTTLILI